MMRCGALSITTTRPRSSVKLKDAEACVADAFCAIDIDVNMQAQTTVQAPTNFNERLSAKRMSNHLSAQAPNANPQTNHA